MKRLSTFLARKFPGRYQSSYGFSSVRNNPSEQELNARVRFFSRAIFAGASFCLITLALLWFFRPLGIIHGPAMWLYKYPLVWFLPLCVFIAVLVPWAGVRRLRLNRRLAELRSEYKEALKQDDVDRSSRWDYIEYAPKVKQRADKLSAMWWRLPLYSALGLGFVAFIVAVAIAPALTGQAIYNHYGFDEIAELPEAGEVRLMPKPVADQLAANGFNSSTEKLSEGHIVRNPDTGKLTWTYQQAPDGVVRTWTKKTAGMATLDAESSARDLKLVDEDFETSPNVRLTDDLRWMAYKANFFTDVAETTFIISGDGEPLLLAPYIGYEGFPVRVPVLAGVYVVHPDGTVEDLSVEEARSRPEIVESGRLFPEALARRIMDSYKYKNGIWNRLFIHTDQTEIADTENNSQPYLMDFGDAGTKWVATAQPRGRSYATNAIFLTDTVSGESEIWKVDRDTALTGNEKALEIVEGLSIPGIVFSGDGDSGGKFEAVEPRPLFIDGKLMFLVSIIPDSHNTVTKSVVVDAASNKAVAVFDHDTDPGADAALKHFIATGELDRADSTDVTLDPETVPDPADSPDAGTEPAPADLSDAEISEIVRQLEANQAEQDALLQELRSRLEGQRP
jgi:hypothetical protein